MGQRGYNSCLFAAGDNRSAQPRPLRGSDIIPFQIPTGIAIGWPGNRAGHFCFSPRPVPTLRRRRRCCSSSTHAQCERPPAPASGTDRPLLLEFAHICAARTVSAASRLKAKRGKQPSTCTGLWGGGGEDAEAEAPGLARRFPAGAGVTASRRRRGERRDAG